MAESSKTEYWGQKALHFKKELNLLQWWKKDAEQKINEELKRLKDIQEEGAQEQLTSRYKSMSYALSRMDGGYHCIKANNLYKKVEYLQGDIKIYEQTIQALLEALK